ncbi:MAG: M13 family metallopeptidase [bacterium]|nr:M13 family metallopeptidase [bacterium]
MKNIVPAFLICTALVVGSASIMKKDLKGIDLNSIDQSVNPGADFYRFANGTWLKNNPVPASESRWGNFNIVIERNNLVLRQILEEAAANKHAEPGSAKGKVGAFYRVFLDTIKRENQGIKPITGDLEAIHKITDTQKLIENIARFHEKGIRCFFGFYVGQDLKSSTKYISYISQGGLGLPDRDYYFKTDSKSALIRDEYVKYIDGLNQLYGFGSEKMGAQILAFETTLAKNAMNRTERRNQEKQYNKRSAKQLMDLYPDVNLSYYFQLQNVPSFDSLIVSHPAFFEALNETFKTSSLSDMKLYMRWCLMNGSAGYLDSKIEQQSFNFYSTILTGTKDQKPMWKKGIAAANGIVGELLGKLFVEKTFSPDSKKRVNAMVDDIVEAFKVRINNLTWMSAETREKALIKLASFNRKFGYPDQWKDYSKLEIKEDSYIENNFRANEFAFNDMVSNLGKPIDRGRWGMNPQTVNAYYSPTLNEIVFPAAIMQPPFFDANADDAVNYGSIGAVIGHELTHGFDDQGAKYGADGNLKSWWTIEDKTKFEEKTKILVNQFNGFYVSDSLHVNGELTLGENIADLGGLTIAYEAYQMRLKKSPGKVINGYTPEQRFFIGFAQIWKNNVRPEALRQLILTDPHSPGEFRVLGTLSNMPQFYAAFGIKDGDKMYRKSEERANIW